MFVIIAMGIFDKNRKNSKIDLYTSISSAINNKMSSTRAIKFYECGKVLEFVTRLWKLKKKIISMVFELMVSLYFDICSNFFTFTMRHSIQEWTN